MHAGEEEEEEGLSNPWLSFQPGWKHARGWEVLVVVVVVVVGELFCTICFVGWRRGGGCKETTFQALPGFTTCLS